MRLMGWGWPARWAVLLGVLLVLAPAWAVDTGTPDQPAAGLDPAFDRYVDLGLLARAWSDKDAVLLTDLGLQLAEGERVLLRSHKAVSADQVLAMAVKVAAEKKDAATLARLNKALQGLKKTELAGQAAAAEKLTAVSRAPDPVLQVQAAQLKPEIYLLVRDTLESITAAKVAGDRETLDIIIELTPQMKQVPDVQRKYLVKMATEARASLSKDAPAVNPAAEALDQLLDDSRGAPRARVQDSLSTGLGVKCRLGRNGAVVSGFTASGPVPLAKGEKLQVGDSILSIGGQATRVTGIGGGRLSSLDELVDQAQEAGEREVLVYDGKSGKVKHYELPKANPAGSKPETPEKLPAPR